MTEKAFEGRTLYLSGAPLFGRLLALPSPPNKRLGRPSEDKHSNLLLKNMNYKKSFIALVQEMHFPFSFCVCDVRLQACDILIITFFSLHDLWPLL